MSKKLLVAAFQLCLVLKKSKTYHIYTRKPVVTISGFLCLKQTMSKLTNAFKMKKLLIISVISLTCIVSACELLDKVKDELSEGDIIEGLKTALNVGADSAVTVTSAVNGYLKDEAIKILLPPEAQAVQQKLNIIKDYGIDLTPYLEDVIKSMNKAAESAASKATPIFKSAITNLTITDGLSILNGKNPADSTGKKAGSSFDSTAATNYLISTTFNQLVDAYATPVNAELGKDLGLGFSANDAWDNFKSAYNGFVDNAGWLLGYSKINTTLSQYVTSKALDGLFLKVGDQERSIRRDPWKWIGDIGETLQKVFGK